MLFSRHVQISNEAALAFYNKFGFRVVDKKEGYYKRIEPADAFVLVKDLTGKDDSVSTSVSN